MTEVLPGLEELLCNDTVSVREATRVGGAGSRRSWAVGHRVTLSGSKQRSLHTVLHTGTYTEHKQ